MITTQQQPIINKHDESILVVKRSELFPDGAWQGVRQVDFGSYLAIIKTHKEFLPRGIMEIDPSYKQIIPYLIFKHADRYFLMQRQAKASENRLRSKLSLGIGGHIREVDMQSDSIIDWAQREFHEEVHYDGNLKIEPLGILNDDSNEVGQVHIGFVFLLHGDSENISIKSELQSGYLATQQECLQQIDLMESWSRMVIELL